MNDRELATRIARKLEEAARALIQMSDRLASRALTVGDFCEPEKYRDWAFRVKALVPQIVVTGDKLEIFFIDADRGTRLPVYEYFTPTA
ncbi:MAG: hypothetical protein ABI790_11370 [Betaproteobacteria bacterium]